MQNRLKMGHNFVLYNAELNKTKDRRPHSVSHVLLWQPSECVHLIVNTVILFLENKYDDDDDGSKVNNF